ncbi:hypothetical protein TWF718_005822 [Orbilia javanica]|uniref:Uncharacterized protein n=1 Tax=Orbilia javanica TaxID=47235 RepID=A0AAN8N250_9PEZI
MKLPSLAIFIFAASVIGAPNVRRSPGDKKDPAILDFQALRDFQKPKDNKNQYYNWYDNIFEDHWGERIDIGYTQFLEETLRKGWDSDSIYRKGDLCVEETTSVDPDPDFAKVPLERIVATPIFCERGIVILVQYDPGRAEPAGPQENRNVPCNSYAYRAYELAAAINNKYDGSGAFDPMFKRKAVPNTPDSLFGKVYQEVVSFKWRTFDEVNLRIVGRTRWSQDQSEWIILAILENSSDNCPFRVESFLANP